MRQASKPTSRSGRLRSRLRSPTCFRSRPQDRVGLRKSASRSDWASKSASKPAFLFFVVFWSDFGGGDKMDKFIDTDFELETQMTTVHVPQTEESFLIENLKRTKEALFPSIQDGTVGSCFGILVDSFFFSFLRVVE